MLIKFKNLKSFCENNINKKIYALYGYNLSHSLSDKLHLELNKYIFCKKNFIYILVNIEKNDFETAIFIAKKYLHGLNITMPYKHSIINYLDIYDKKLKSINTVKIINNKLIGFNTDINGFIYTVNKNKIFFEKKTILILGYGGLSKTIIQYILFLHKNSNIKIFVYIRNKNKISNIKKIIFININELKNNYDVIINCTPVGMYPNINNCFILENIIKNSQIVIEMIYNPLQTNLIKLAIKNNIKNYINGLEMFVMQAMYSNYIWNNKNFNKNFNIINYKLFLKILLIKMHLKTIYNKKNIIFCGFTSIGKTTLGILLSKLLKIKFIDIDFIITQFINMKIPNIFKYFGESFFRIIEKKITIHILSKYINCIISLGGGAVKNIDETDLIKKFGLILFLYSRYSFVIKKILKYKKNSPLIKKNLELIFYQRLNSYIENSHIIINMEISNNINDVINLIFDSI